VKKRARARPEEAITLTIVKERDGSGRSHWADNRWVTKAHFYTHTSFGADNRSRSVDVWPAENAAYESLCKHYIGGGVLCGASAM